jgi:hypothetical protein
MWRFSSSDYLWWHLSARTVWAVEEEELKKSCCKRSAFLQRLSHPKQVKLRLSHLDARVKTQQQKIVDIRGLIDDEKEVREERFEGRQVRGTQLSRC